MADEEKDSNVVHDAGESNPRRLSRRDVVKIGALGAVGIASAGGTVAFAKAGSAREQEGGAATHAGHGPMMSVGEVRPGGFDPVAFLTHFDMGTVSTLPTGQTLREFSIGAVDQEIEVVHSFPTRRSSDRKSVV